jgi:hypothetical protein
MLELVEDEKFIVYVKVDDSTPRRYWFTAALLPYLNVNSKKKQIYIITTPVPPTRRTALPIPDKAFIRNPFRAVSAVGTKNE